MKIKDHNIYVVAYHYVHPKKKSIFQNLKSLELKDFKDQISYFQKNYNLINYEDFCSIMIEKKITKKPCFLLTFDDGYKDHYDYVFPYLCKKKINGIFFPMIEPIVKNNVSLTNKIHLILSKNNNHKNLLSEIKKTLKKKFDIDLEKFYKKFILVNEYKFDSKTTAFIKLLLQNLLEIPIREFLINNLFKNYNEKETSKKLYLNKSEIKEMLDNKMIFGIHGYSHERLGEMSKDNQKKDLMKVIKFFINTIGTKFNYDIPIAYPFGSYNRNTINVLKNANISYGFNAKLGSINKKNISHIYDLPRIETNFF
jgi:peptidoglycan/xylan/chitin deacetylase (PgdA/CDA1 family)